MSTICTDAGHGGDKPGAIWGNIMEKDLNLTYVLALNAELRQRGHQVFTTRRSDSNVTPLITRCQLINEHHQRNSPKFDAIISLHCDVAVVLDQETGEYRPRPNVQGLYAIYSRESVQSTALAKAIADTCQNSDLKLNHGGMMSTIQLGRNLAWIHRTIPTATLLELGYMTNPEELENLQRDIYRTKLVKSIADGIDAFLSN